MHRIASIALLLLAAGAVAQTPKTAPKRPATTQKKSSGVAKKSTTAKKTASKSRKRVVPRKRTQPQPTAERYTEIQNALIARRHFQGPATGVWGVDWASALKRFQEEQKLEATGKIDALSLMRLGLGPKREVSAQNSGLQPSEPR